MHQIDRFAGTYFFLSNFSRHTVRGANGLVYPTAEAAFHGGKTNDPALRAWIAAAPTPKAAKARGRTVPLRLDWNDHRHVVVPLHQDRVAGRQQKVLARPRLCTFGQ